MSEMDAMWQSRPIVQESKIDGHVDITFPASQDSIVLDDEIARRMAENIFRVVQGHDSETEDK